MNPRILFTILSLYLIALIIMLITGYRRPRAARLAVRPMGIAYSAILVIFALAASLLSLASISWLLIGVLTAAIAVLNFRTSLLIPHHSNLAMWRYGLVALLIIGLIMASQFLTTALQIKNLFLMFVLALPPIGLALLTFFGFRQRISHTNHSR